jgi:SAM-dependent methyltransferase
MSKALEILTPTERWQKFAEDYMGVRQSEFRLPDDALLKNLPEVPASHPYAKAWKLRKSGMQNLLDALRKNLPQGAHVLDIGCGNGWMSNRMAEAGFNVTGIDVTLPELEQAHRVFARPGLRFAFADLFVWQPDVAFTTAVLASAIQYFEEPKILLKHLFTANPNLQTIFICDSPFYSSTQKKAASQRSNAYYQKQGYPTMASHYHHHALADLGHPCTVLKSATPPLVRKLIGGSPFPLIKVTSSL